MCFLQLWFAAKASQNNNKTKTTENRILGIFVLAVRSVECGVWGLARRRVLLVSRDMLTMMNVASELMQAQGEVNGDLTDVGFTLSSLYWSHEESKLYRY